MRVPASPSHSAPGTCSSHAAAAAGRVREGGGAGARGRGWRPGIPGDGSPPGVVGGTVGCVLGTELPYMRSNNSGFFLVCRGTSAAGPGSKAARQPPDGAHPCKTERETAPRAAAGRGARGGGGSVPIPRATIQRTQPDGRHAAERQVTPRVVEQAAVLLVPPRKVKGAPQPGVLVHLPPRDLLLVAGGKRRSAHARDGGQSCGAAGGARRAHLAPLEGPAAPSPRGK